MELARVVSLNWYGKDALDILTRIAKYTGKSEGEIERRLHLNAVNKNDVFLDKGYIPPAKLLPQLADDEYINPLFILQKNTKPIRNDKSSNSETKAAIQTKIEKRIKSMKGKASVNTEIKPIKSQSKVQSPVDLPELKKKKKVDKKSEIKRPLIKSENTPVVSSQLGSAIKTFQQMVSQGKPAHELIEYAVKMSLLCGVQRCIFVVKIPNKKILVSRYSSQVSESIIIKQLKIPIEKPHVFSILMEKSRNLFLNDLNRSKYWNAIPDAVKLCIGVKQFFVMSIFVNNHAMGMMYADKVKGELTIEEFKQFLGICRLLTKGIVQSAHNKNKH